MEKDKGKEMILADFQKLKTLCQHIEYYNSSQELGDAKQPVIQRRQYVFKSPTRPDAGPLNCN